jgi:hypothetical protein
MSGIRVVAISTELAEVVRERTTDPQFGFPVYTAPAGAGLPCRHCLDWIVDGSERATLFTLDPFAHAEKLPLPGPVYIHADGCERYPENSVIPMRLMASPRTLNAYASGADPAPIPAPRCGLRSCAQHDGGLLHISDRARAGEIGWGRKPR